MLCSFLEVICRNLGQLLNIVVAGIIGVIGALIGQWYSSRRKKIVCAPLGIIKENKYLFRASTGSDVSIPLRIINHNIRPVTLCGFYAEIPNDTKTKKAMIEYRKNGKKPDGTPYSWTEDPMVINGWDIYECTFKLKHTLFDEEIKWVDVYYLTLRNQYKKLSRFYPDIHKVRPVLE